jgi:hypothetical protein
MKDEKTLGGMPAWVMRCHNMTDSTLDEKTGLEGRHFGTVVVKSMLWPGAFTFYNNKRTQFIYCGDGLKHETQTYFPIEPPMMVDEVPEKKPCDEPNPTPEWLA